MMEYLSQITNYVLYVRGAVKSECQASMGDVKSAVEPAGRTEESLSDV